MYLYLRQHMVTGSLWDLEIDSKIPEIQNKSHSMNLQSEILATSQYLEECKRT